MKEDQLQLLNTVPLTNTVSLTVKLLMQRKEVGVIIGKKGEAANLIRTENNVHLNISDSSTVDRVVSISGGFESVMEAFSTICINFEASEQRSGQLTFRMLVPASQCGSVIGRAGIKINGIRESTGASVQVTGDVLPNSTERALLISAQSSAPILAAFREICTILVENPPKSDNIPYNPCSTSATYPHPFFLMNGNGQMSSVPFAATNVGISQAGQMATNPAKYMTPEQALAFLSLQASIPGLMNPQPPPPPPPLPYVQMATGGSREMVIPNELVGCIIGRGGRKITEIRQMSGANIKISDIEEGHNERQISISGSPEQIAFAEALIKARIATEIQTATYPSTH